MHPFFFSAAIGYLEVETSWTEKKDIFLKKILQPLHDSSQQRRIVSIFVVEKNSIVTDYHRLTPSVKKKRNENSLCVWIVTFFTTSSPSSNLWKKVWKTVTRDRSKLSAWEDMHASAYYAASESSFFWRRRRWPTKKRNDEPRSWVRLGVFPVSAPPLPSRYLTLRSHRKWVKTVKTRS